MKSKLLRKTITGFVESSEEKENFAPWPLNVVKISWINYDM